MGLASFLIIIRISFSLTNKSNNVGFGTDVSDNEKNISEFISETGNYEIEINTQSNGILIKDIEIADSRITLVFNKKILILN
ncbi:hypothetical protein [Aquimarina sp. RZ0]|uniref:hypothetical protein n=1 Tax=Aquimarina sp. RZ0 TaxID=2607730 RepID=UPI0011F09CC6|nr:hypothetical protein [Aquimarina sp. RZ0]KAA1245571.1 hypothetical protein F0000_11520 [Aquimarina sp. RZ0]